MAMVLRQILGWARLGGLLCLLAVLGPALPAISQTAEQAPVPSALVQLQLVSETPKETRFRLTFAPRLNHFGAVGSSSQQAALGFALSSRRVSPRR